MTYDLLILQRFTGLSTCDKKELSKKALQKAYKESSSMSNSHYFTVVSIARKFK